MRKNAGGILVGKAAGGSPDLTGLLHGTEQLVLLELFDVQLRLLAGPGPDDAFSFLMDIQHHLFRALAAVSENAPDDHGDVGHQIDRVIENDDMPRLVEVGAFLLLDEREGFRVGAGQSGHGPEKGPQGISG